jgi:hypothetical protein
VAFLSLAAIVYKYREDLSAFAAEYVDPAFFRLTLDQYVLVIALFTVVPHFVEIVYQYVSNRFVCLMCSSFFPLYLPHDNVSWSNSFPLKFNVRL